MQLNLPSVYINASPVSGTKLNYIAAQAPKQNTIDSFWQMVWENQTQHIIVLTKEYEGSTEKCTKYWPSFGEVKSLDAVDLTVTMQDEQSVAVDESSSSDDPEYVNFVANPLYTVRTFEMSDSKKVCVFLSINSTKNTSSFQPNINQTRPTVNQFQLLFWPDHGVPKVNNFHRFYTAINQHFTKKTTAAAGSTRGTRFLAGTRTVPPRGVPGTAVRPTKLQQSSGRSICLLYTSPSPRDKRQSRMPSSA